MKKKQSIPKRLEKRFMFLLYGKGGTTFKEEMNILEDKWDERFKISFGNVATAIILAIGFSWVIFLGRYTTEAFKWIFYAQLRDNYLEPFYSTLGINITTASAITITVLTIIMTVIIFIIALRSVTILFRYINKKL